MIERSPIVELLLRAVFQQAFQFRHEFLHILEIQINRGEPDVRDFVEFLDTIHQELADLAGLALALGRFMDKALYFVHQRLELCRGHGPLLARLQQALQNFLPVKAFAAPVLLDHHVRDFVDAFIRRVAPAALQAFPAAADQITGAALARINNLVFHDRTKWALHRAESPRNFSLTAPEGLTPFAPGTVMCLPASSASASARANLRNSPMDS